MAAAPPFQREWLTWAILFALGTTLLVLGMGQEAVWSDEGFSMAMIRHPPAEIVALTHQDSHGSPYYLALRAWSLLFGEGVVALRGFSVLGALALAGLGPGPVRRLAGREVGLVFAACVFLSPALITHAQEVRAYTWTPFLTTAALVFALLAARHGRRADWVLTGLAMAGAMVLHPVSLVGMFAFSVVFGVHLALHRRAALLPFLLTTGLAGLLYLPRLVGLVQYTSQVSSSSFWIPPVHLLQVLRFLWDPVKPFHCPLTLHALTASSAVLVVLLVGGGLAIWRARPERELLGMVAASWLATLGLLLVISTTFMPILGARYSLTLYGWVALSLAIALTSLGTGVRLAALASLVVVLAPQYVAVYGTRCFGPADAAGSVCQALEPGAPVAHLDPGTLSTLGTYCPSQRHYLVDTGVEPVGVAIFGHLEARISPEELMELGDTWVFCTAGPECEQAFEELSAEPELRWEEPQGYCAMEALHLRGR